MLGVIENPRLELLRIVKVEKHTTNRPVLDDTLERRGCVETITSVLTKKVLT